MQRRAEHCLLTQAIHYKAFSRNATNIWTKAAQRLAKPAWQSLWRILQSFPTELSTAFLDNRRGVRSHP
jgi:hypothetical protein